MAVRLSVVEAERGRGAAGNLPNRFVPIALEPDAEALEADRLDGIEAPAVPTRVLHDRTQSVLTYNDSPDIAFDVSLNPYRGCEHGCIYCYARPTHEYFGYSLGLDFETVIFAKPEAPALLERELRAKSYRPMTIAMSGITDCYQPIERRMRITRQCLEVLLRFRNGVGIVTKNHLVTRDLDVLSQLARLGLARVDVSVTSLDVELARKMEPRASSPARRIEAIRRCAEAGVPVGVIIAPVIPSINDKEIPAILQAAKQAGARWAHFTMLRLPFQIKELFLDWLTRHFPDRAGKVESQIREMRGGELNVSEFGARMRGTGARADQIESLFDLWRIKLGLDSHGPKLRTDLFRRSGEAGLFDFD